MAHIAQTLLRGAAALSLLSLFTVPTAARADRARVSSLGGVDLLIEDDSDIYLNPAHIGVYSNRAWFSLGVTGGAGVVGFDPMGGGAVRIKDMVSLGVVLNRSPSQYTFDKALWPVLEQYIPGGPGGTLSGPAGPAEETAPLRFPVDLFIGVGNKDRPVRVGLNIYYAGGAFREIEIEDRNDDGLDNQTTVRRQSHLFNVTLGVAGGRQTDRIRPEGWLRAGVVTAWADRISERETDNDAFEETVDRILALDRDLRIGGGARVHIGDPTALRGVVVSPGFQYDVAFGAFRFDDNLVNPDSAAEDAIRRVTGHSARLGVGVAGRIDDLRVFGTGSLTLDAVNRFDQTRANNDEVEQNIDDYVAFAVPELSVGAEYRVLPVLLVRAGVKSTVGGGRTINTVRNNEGPEETPGSIDVAQTIDVLPVNVTFEANGGLGLQVRRFSLDATFGGLFLGQAGTSFISRIDLSFNFD